MLDLLFAAQTAPSITIQLPTAMTWVLASIGVLLAVIAYFLRRELNSNDEAHRELRADVKRLLSGDVAWVKALLDRRQGSAP